MQPRGVQILGGDLCRLDLVDDPTPLRFRAARDLFERGIAECKRCGDPCTPDVCALVGEAILREPRAVHFGEFYKVLDEEQCDALVKRLDTKPCPGEADTPHARALCYSAVVAVYIARYVIEHLMGRCASRSDLERTFHAFDDVDYRGSSQITKLCPSDPRVWRLLAAYHIRKGDAVRAADAFERSLDAARALPEDDARRENWFSALYSLATVRESLEGTNRRKVRERTLRLLDEFLAVAPSCHYHLPNACFWRSSAWVELCASSAGTTVPQIAAKFPEDVELSSRLFVRAQEALAYQRRHFPLQPSSQMEADAHALQRLFAKAGVIASVPRAAKQCWAADCLNAGASSCARCKVAVYCGPSCQRLHWKAEHKAECDDLALNRQRKEAEEARDEHERAASFAAKTLAEGKDPNEYVRAPIVRKGKTKPQIQKASASASAE